MQWLNTSRTCSVTSVSFVGDVESAAVEIVDEAVRLDPCLAVVESVTESVTELTDYGPDGHAARAEAARRARTRLAALTPSDAREALLRDHLMERMDVRMAFHDVGEDQRELHPVVTGPLQLIAQTVRLAVPADYDQVLVRLRGVPDALLGVQAALRSAAGRGHVAAARQVDECIRRCPGWVADVSAIVKEYGDGPLARELATAAFKAGAAYAGLESLLKRLRADAPDEDAFGEERYRLWVRRYLGAEPDLHDLYAWGWDEFHGIEAAMRREAANLVPGGTPTEAVTLLDGPDGPGKVAGRDGFRAWLQMTLDASMSQLDGVHFRVPPEIRAIDTELASGAGIYYTPPSPDLTRSGRVTWSLAGEPRYDTGPYDTWYAHSIAYHEGVPGHHLHLGLAALRGDELSSRLEIFGGRAACYEGWALYAESLMDELGYFVAPGAHLGYLLAQALRAARVIIDIGMHLKLRIPSGAGFGADDGAVWTPDLGLRMLTERALQGGGARFELVRYLGRPGQALSYKTGERVFRNVRAEAMMRPGFDLATFHERVLGVDACGLAHLETELTRVTAAPA
jgi:uncharacterized protein (DUF885 family)